jgi:steroid Delta-isomerase
MLPAEEEDAMDAVTFQPKVRLQTYLDTLASGDVDAVIALYDPSATCEDPVGGDVYRGLGEIGDFYRRAMSAGRLVIEPLSPIVSTTSNHAAVAARVKTSRGVIHFVETQAYNDQGKIVQMRAYYDPADIKAD